MEKEGTELHIVRLNGKFIQIKMQQKYKYNYKFKYKYDEKNMYTYKKC